MTLKCAKWMMRALGGNIGVVRSFWRIKRAKVNVFSVSLDRGLPPARTECFYPNQSTGVVAARPTLVLAVLRGARIAQVGDSVVIGDAVDVVDVALGPDSVHIEPSEPVFCTTFASNPDAAIAALNVPAAGPVAWLYLGRLWKNPRKYTRIRAVIKQVAQMLCGNIGISHDALLKQIGQKPSSASSLAGLRHFNVGGSI